MKAASLFTPRSILPNDHHVLRRITKIFQLLRVGPSRCLLLLVGELRRFPDEKSKI